MKTTQEIRERLKGTVLNHEAAINNGNVVVTGFKTNGHAEYLEVVHKLVDNLGLKIAHYDENEVGVYQFQVIDGNPPPGYYTDVFNDPEFIKEQNDMANVVTRANNKARADLANLYFEGGWARKDMELQLAKLLAISEDDYATKFVEVRGGDYDWSLEIDIWGFKHEEFKLSEEALATIYSWGVKHFWVNFMDTEDESTGDMYFNQSHSPTAFRAR